ncbi:MAG TPA: PAS domain S-box protein, partial [Chloroflexota bacterium]
LFRRSRTASPRERDVALRHKDGSTVWAIVSGVPMIDENDGTRGMLAMFTNVTERKLSEERAVAAAQQIERLTADAIYTVDRGGVIRSWNDGAERMFGWTKQEIVGRGPALVPAHLRATATEAILRIVDAGETLIRETVRLTKDGEPVPVLGSWSPVPLPEGGTGVLCILKDTREQQAAHQKLEEQAKSLALLRERERIAMDLHDGVIQSLYGVTLSLGGLRRLQDRRSPDHGVLGHAITQLTETVQGIRDYIFELRAGAPENAADLEAGLRAAAEDLSVTSGITSRVSVAADLARLPAGTISHLLYIVREALSNVARHARATEVAITVEPHRRGLTLTLTDNGRGFDPRRRGRRLGDGLRNMRWRAGQLGATLAIDSAPGAGTTVRVELP